MSKRLLIIFALITNVLAAGCSTTREIPSVKYLALNIPDQPIHTTGNNGDYGTSSSRISIGVYRPPANAEELIKMLDADANGGIYRDMDVILQTSMCLFPVVCFATDQVRAYKK